MLYLLSISEVLAMLFPLSVLWRRNNHLVYLKPIKIYLFAAVVLNVLCVSIDKYFYYVSNSIWLTNNNYLYNIHSIVRFLCFCWFFDLLHQPFLKKVKQILPYATAISVVFIFLKLDVFFGAQTISNNLFALESGVLLFYCLQYYLFKLQEDDLSYKTPDFWITTGLSIYVVFNFPFFLLYTSLSQVDQSFWWNIHNISYVIFCIFIAIAFYVAGDKR
jgi:hypothetical protein